MSNLRLLPKVEAFTSFVRGCLGNSVAWTGSTNSVNTSRIWLSCCSNVWPKAFHRLFLLWCRLHWIRMKVGHLLKHQPVSQRVPMNPGGHIQSPLPSWHTPPFKHSGQSLLQSWPHFLLEQAAGKNNLVFIFHCVKFKCLLDVFKMEDRRRSQSRSETRFFGKAGLTLTWNLLRCVWGFREQQIY